MGNPLNSYGQHPNSLKRLIEFLWVGYPHILGPSKNDLVGADKKEIGICP